MSVLAVEDDWMIGFGLWVHRLGFRGITPRGFIIDQMIETTELVSLFSLFWKTLEAHCFHYFLTDSPTKQSENSENSELLDSSKTVQ